MPLFRGILRYTENNSGLGWTVVNYRTVADPAAFKALADPFNTAYLHLCPGNVSLVDFRVSQDGIYRDEYVADGTTFANHIGLAPGENLPVSTAIIWKGYGTTVTQGQSKWYFHGIASSYDAGGTLETNDPLVAGFNTAGFTYLYQYRPRISPKKGLPIVNPPAAFLTKVTAGFYVRKLGRPFGFPGQQQRFARA